MKWYNPQKEPFKISGLAFYEQDGLYRRMPLNPVAPLPEAVYNLADETSGGQIRFHAKLKKLSISVSVASKKLHFDGYTAPHLAGTNKRGFDLYASTGGDYEFVAVTSDFNETDLYHECTFFDSESEIEADFLLNFPLYGAVDKVLIGFDDDAVITQSQKHFADDRKIVFYGGSIEQGACASRPGMNETNILSRWLNREVYNLGFNSSGKAEPEVAEVIAGIDNVAALIISTEGNCPDSKWLDEKLREFIKIYRKNHPDTAIVIMPFLVSAKEKLISEKYKERLEKIGVQKKIVADLSRAGDKNIYLFAQDMCAEKEFEGNSVWHEMFSDGLHKTDLGYLATAKGLYKLLKTIL
ncbi:MAG: hypothetical protein E7395_08660 [Ruminococcaceae bacterium]|nr:hypothetical protein [Oscillospiraceae bacterium]